MCYKKEFHFCPGTEQKIPKFQRRDRHQEPYPVYLFFSFKIKKFFVFAQVYIQSKIFSEQEIPDSYHLQSHIVI